ncbi:MAG: hypothetical protein NZ455_14960 [Bacteroidia bacterium]|nr:hypothetical protein [Bacteroidia bacterium]MDW8347888.1 hypothetical protein [Bacteroidia bacterium]
MFQSLYQDYCRKHLDRYISQDEVEALVMMTPMLIVAKCDGHIDTKELLSVIENLEIMYRIDDDPLNDLSPTEDVEITDDDLKEVEYFMQDFSVWEQRLLELHKIYIGTDIEKKRLSLIMMEAVADAHHEAPKDAVEHVLDENNTTWGKNISETERKTILKLCDYLGISSEAALANELKRLQQPQTT